MLLTLHSAVSHSLRWKAHLIRFGLEIFSKVSQPTKKNNLSAHSKICSEAALPLCNGPHSVCGVCFSLNLNKFTSYLSLCLSLNSVCDEKSRT